MSEQEPEMSPEEAEEILSRLSPEEYVALMDTVDESEAGPNEIFDALSLDADDAGEADWQPPNGSGYRPPVSSEEAFRRLLGGR